MKKYILTNKQLSKILSKFWDYGKIDMFADYKLLKDDIIIEYDKYYELNSKGENIEYHKFLYYWKDDKLSEVFNRKLEPAMMHILTKQQIYYKFYDKVKGKKNNFQFNINLHNDGFFIKSTSLIVKEKELNTKNILSTTKE